MTALLLAKQALSSALSWPHVPTLHLCREAWDRSDSLASYTVCRTGASYCTSWRTENQACNLGSLVRGLLLFHPPSNSSLPSRRVIALLFLTVLHLESWHKNTVWQTQTCSGNLLFWGCLLLTNSLYCCTATYIICFPLQHRVFIRQLLSGNFPETNT